MLLFCYVTCCPLGKNTPSSQLSSTAEDSAHLGSANSTPATNHLQQDDVTPVISPVVRTEPPSATQPSNRSGQKQDSVNITPFVTQTAPKVDGGVKQLASIGEGLSTGTFTVFATPASQRAQTSSELKLQWYNQCPDDQFLCLGPVNSYGTMTTVSDKLLIFEHGQHWT